MNLKEQVFPSLIPHFHGKRANDASQFLLHEAKVSGFVLFRWSNELSSRKQVKELCTSLLEQAGRPLILAVDQEGGGVSRLQYGFSSLPSAEEAAVRLSTEAYTGQVYQLGREMKECGLTHTFAPVVDVGQRGVIGPRSYGLSQEVVVRYARAFLNGMQKAGISCCLKHFPGHGEVEADSHLELPKSHLQENHLVPYRELADQAGQVMLGHLLVPEIDKDLPATLSSNHVAFLRQHIGFQGSIITDSLVMRGVLSEIKELPQVAVAAWQAGCDSLLLGGRSSLSGQEGVEASPEQVLEVVRHIEKLIIKV